MTHLLVVTYPLQGHLIPSVHLALSLASRNLSVTFLTTQSIHQSSTRSGFDCFASARDNGLDIDYKVASDGLPLDYDRSLNHDEFMGSLLTNYESLVEEVVKGLERRIDYIVADTFFVWPGRMARRMGIGYVSFWTEPAAVFALYYHLQLLIDNGHFANDKGPPRTDAVTYIPGIDSIDRSDLMSYLQETDTTSVVHKIIFNAFEDVKLADYVICNTVQELEPKTISALQSEKPFFAIGPIFPEIFTKSNVKTSLWTETDCAKWLDSQPKGSVLYVSFGSYAHLTKEQLQEIAFGVRDSGVRFLWVLRPDIVSSEDLHPLPDEFFDETKERGMVVPWCCQKEVLAHESVGGFLTHCGWNSVLESMWCGVPMLCFPLLTDQFTNRKLVAKDWRVGIDLGGVNTVVKSVNVSDSIKKLMEEKQGKDIRLNLEKIRKMLESTKETGGSSHNNFNCFIDGLTGKNKS